MFMLRSNNGSLTNTTQPYSPYILGCVVLVFFLLSCSSIPLTRQETLFEDESALTINYSMVFIVHGDGDYLYHDTSGQTYRADKEAVARAIKVAMRNPQAEVFIFHQRPRKHTLLLFPRRDGKFYYYQNGRLLAQKLYWRTQGQSRFDAEVELYHRFHAKDQTQFVRMFLYFGHEIPEYNGAGYDASYPHQTFTVNNLADGLKRITPDSTKFDLFVLSTCFSGTPHTIAALAPYARTIIASPDNLHLSYFDLQPFERLDVGLPDGDVAAFSNKFAQHAFDRLNKDIQTAITVAVYDVDRVQEYVQAVDSVYDHTLTSLKSQKPGSIEHCDCAEESAYVLPEISEGVNVFYRPPHFGRLKHKQNHSGWECWMFLE